MDNYFPAMKSIAAIGLAKQKRNPGDFTDDAGFLVCGRCGQRRQKMIAVPNPDKDHTTDLMVVSECQCDKDANEAEAKRVQAMKDRDEAIRLRSISLMEQRFKDARFGVFQITKYNGRNLKLCQRYVDKFNEMMEKNQGLLFWGDVGTGKSFAAGCIANALLDRAISVVMTSFTAINKVLDADASKADDIIGRIKSAKLVIFDDLGTERDTGTSIERVYNIVDHRYRMNLPMIVTTNRTLDEMKSDDDIRYRRIYDRIFEVCYPMQFTGPSWRIKAAARAWDEMGKLLED